MKKLKSTPEKDRTPTNTPLAIVGIGCLFPGASDANSYWTNIREGVDAITDIPESHWRPEDYFDQDPRAPDMTYARRGGFIDPVEFDPLLYGLSPNNIEATDTTQLLGMVVARQALLDAGYSTTKDNHDGRPFDRDRTSVILGVTGTLELVIPLGARLGHPIWRKAMADAGVGKELAEEIVQRISERYVPWQENSFPGLLGNVAAGRIANRFDLGGTNCVVDAACASSLGAVHLAAMELYAGRTDMAITGGFDTFNDIFMYMCFSKTPALSPTGDSRPFSVNGDGTILGEGLGVCVLKRLDDARADGDKIYAVLRGLGTSSDGRGNAIYAPSAGGQTKALLNAYREAGVSPATIELVEAHGTGTRVGDAVEAEALSGVYRAAKDTGTWCAIGSVKSMIGHTKAAAGVAGLIKIAMALKQKTLPPTIKVDRPLDILEPGKSPLYVNTSKRPWLGNNEHPRRAAISAFGFGGSNFHCVLEEAEPAKADIEWDGKVLLLAFSADSTATLKKDLCNVNTRLGANEPRAAAARSLAEFKHDHTYRLILVVTAETSLAGLVANALKMLDEKTATAWSTADGAYFGSGNVAGKLAMLFPGQGSQYPGMLLDLACQFPQMQAVLTAANELSGPVADNQRLSDLIYPLPVFTEEAQRKNVERLRATQYAQPAIGAVSLGALRILEHFGIKADITAGHSFGELTALCAAGRIEDTGLQRLAIKRGELMQISDGDHGSMLAVSASAAVVHEFLEAEQLDLIIANNNAPKQVVLSGASTQIDKAANLLKKRGISATHLPVAAAFHSSYVAEAEKPFARFLKPVEFLPGRIPVYANTTSEMYPEDPDQARKLLARQLASPVEFVAEIENIHAAGARTFLEVGPGNTLSGLAKSILHNREHHLIAMDASKGRRGGQYDLGCVLAQLATLGHAVDLERWDPTYRQAQTRQIDKKPAMTITLTGANYVKPRPPREASSTQHQPEPVLHQAAMDMPRSDTPAPVMKAEHTLPVSTQQSILLLQKMQEETAALHRQYLQGQEAALQTIRTLIGQQQQLSQGRSDPDRSPALASAPLTAEAPAPVTPVLPVQPQAMHIETPAMIDLARQTAVVTQTNSGDFDTLLLEVVAGKTGYPVEMLSLDMSLDTDLGIDSIKRVEILSALQEKLPGARKINPEDLGTFQLLKHIADFLSAGEKTTAPQKTPHTETVDHGYQQALLAVVAEKTGYPVEMLNLDMNLDTDLGIDSIKRVEILSAFQEKMPEAPAVNPEDLARLQTLQQIVDFMGGSRPDETNQPRAVNREPGPARAETSAQLWRGLPGLVPIDDNAERQCLTLKQDGVIYIAGETSGLGEQLCRQFTALGLDSRYIRMDDAPAADIAGLIIVAPPDPDYNFIGDAFSLMQRCGASLKTAAERGHAVLAAVTRLGGGFGIVHLADTGPSAAGLAGLIKTADREWPQLSCKVIDVEYPHHDVAQLSATIAGEILLAGPVETGIRDNRCYTLRLDAVPAAHTDSNLLLPGDLVVVSGGARGITAEVAVELAHSSHTSLLLLGRSPEPEPEPTWLQGLDAESSVKKAIVANNTKTLTPRELETRYRLLMANREILHTLERIRKAGVKVHYRCVDIRDQQRLKVIVASVRSELGPVRGIIHGAGILADKRIEDKTREQFDEVYSTKVAGLSSLLKACESDELKLLVLFSSSTARYGRKGQIDYAAANEVLNKCAQQQQRLRPACRVLSLNWGPWDGGMVTPQLRGLFEAEGVGVIPLRAGAQHLVKEICTQGPVERVVFGSQPAAETASAPYPIPTTGRAPEMHLAFERSIGIGTMPVLTSHVMNGKAVLPVALITEWLAHGAIHENPGLLFSGFRDLKIFKGIILEEDKPLTVQIHASRPRQLGRDHLLQVQLRNGDVLHAGAGIILTEEFAAPPASVNPVVSGPYSLGNSDVYISGLLFHGKDLHGIRSIHACSDTGIAASVRTAPAPSSWMAQPIRSGWLADPLILDSAFQLVILWSFEKLGVGSLPVGIGHYRQFQRGFPGHGVGINVRITSNNNHYLRADIDFIDAGGKLLARIDDYECITDASLAEAFRRNRLHVESPVE